MWDMNTAFLFMGLIGLVGVIGGYIIRPILDPAGFEITAARQEGYKEGLSDYSDRMPKEYAAGWSDGYAQGMADQINSDKAQRPEPGKSLPLPDFMWGR